MLLALFLLLLSVAQQAQVPLVNPSFEGAPAASAIPYGWISISPGSTPDILPGAWGLQGAPYDGATFVGLVTREDGTREEISQNLPVALAPDVCYRFSVYLAHLPTYVGYNQPVRLRVWGGPQNKRAELLASSPLITHKEWRKYTFEFIPDQSVQCMTLEAYFGPGVLFYYKGNILLDNCSSVERCDRA